MPRKVLIVEDDLLNRMFYHEVLVGDGYEVVTVGDGALVMDEVRRVRPDLVTMDIQLPNISGLRLIRQIRQAEDTRDIPVLAITAFVGRHEEERIRRAGAQAYLAKPVTIPALTAKIEELLRQ